MQEELIKCPRCGSTQIHADKKGFGTGKAIAGTLVGGLLVGAAVGSIGKDKIVLTCLKCGNTFKIGDSESKITSSATANVEGYVGYSETATYKCPRCEKISTISGSSYCPKCGNKLSQADVYVEPQKSSNTWIIVVAIILIAIALLLLSCSSSGEGIKAGETVTTNQQCLAASSQDSFDNLNKVCNRKDNKELSRMITNKEAFILDKGTKIKVADLKFGTVIGEVRSGELIFESVYVSREFVE